MGYKDAKGWLRPEEREALVKYASKVESKFQPIIINIGVEYGASLACLRQGAASAIIYGIDIDISKAVSSYHSELIEADSRTLWEQWPEGRAVDLLFIDGDHSYDGVCDDTNWTFFVRKWGYVIFHDCYDYEDPSIVHRLVPGVNQAVEEWLEKYKSLWMEEEAVGTMRIFKRV